MVYEKTFKLKGAIFTQHNLVKLMNSCSPYFARITISVEFKDGSKKSSMNSSEFENETFQNKKIKEINLHGSSYSGNYCSTLWVRTNYSNNYELQIESAEYDQYIKICDLIDNWIVEISSRRQYISLLNSWYAFALCCMTAYIPMFFTAKSMDDIPIIAIVWFLPAFGLGGFVSMCIKYAFPLTEVDIGTNHRRMFRKFVWGVVSLLVIPIILSIIL